MTKETKDEIFLRKKNGKLIGGNGCRVGIPKGGREKARLLPHPRVLLELPKCRFVLFSLTVN